MKSKIFKSICSVGIGVLLLSLVLIMGVLYEYFTSVQLRQLESQTYLVATAVEDEGVSYLNSLGSIDSTEYRITWIKNTGEVLYDSKASVNDMENHLERPEIKEAISDGVGSSIRYSDTMLYKSLYSARSLKDGTILRLSVSQSSLWAIIFSMIQPLLIVALVAVLVSLYLAYRLSNNIVKPINDLNLDNPKDGEYYEELTPLVDRLYYQQKEINNIKDELNQKRSEFNAATKNLSEGLILLNEEGTILSINDFACKILDITTYAVGKDLLIFNNTNEINELLKVGKSGHHSEKIINIKDINYDFYASPIISNDKVNGIALLIFDMSEKEKAELMRKEFTANVSHELKTPLQNISGSAELLMNGLVKQDDVGKFSTNIYNESKRLMNLIDDIIKLSYLDEDTIEKKADINLYDSCKTIIDSLKPNADKNKVTVNIEGDKPVVKAVPQLINMTIYNLVDNAIKYNKENGSVDVLIKDDKDSVKLTVKDTGIGIPKEDLDRIFERFYRVDKSRSKEVGGTGLGLSIVKHAVKSSDGTIDIDSKLNEGTNITITLNKNA